jgi:cyclopropane fatty-acyl-phospholipid synthase-like methyltransferase
MEKEMSDERHINKYSQEIREAKEMGVDQFHAWFNKSQNFNESLVRGFWDFSCHILTDIVCSHIQEPEEKTCLEIGYGGGRLLNAASNYFKEAIGIDIHDEVEYVREFLKSQGRDNFRLIRTSGKTIKVDPGSIDFVYSFIVLQHLQSFESFCNYLKETYICLKKRGVAQLYYGTWAKLSSKDQILNWNKGYKEITDAKVNHTSLVLRNAKVKRLCLDLGFKVLDCGNSYKQVPDGYLKKIGGQNYITLLKS